MIEKQARKPSADPVQEKLRQDKATLNKDMSLFITDVINFKKLLNGAPNKFFKEKSKIQNPIPANPSTIISALVSDFNDLAQRSNSIVEEQISYSKNHRPKQQKVPSTNIAPTTTPTADLAKQLSAWEQKYELTAEGSNKLTRLLTRVTNPTIGFGTNTNKRRHRMAMLKSCAKIYKMLGKLQVQIVKSSKDSVQASHDLMQDIWNQWGLVLKSFASYKEIMGDQTPAIENKPEEPKDNKEQAVAPTKEQAVAPTKEVSTDQSQAKQIADLEAVEMAKVIRKDFSVAINNKKLYDATIFEGLSEALNKFVKTPTPQKADIARVVITQYQNLLQTLNQKYSTTAQSLKDIGVILSTKKETPIPNKTNEQLETVSQAFLKKWLGKTRHNLLPNDTSTYRLEIFEIIKDVRSNVDGLMDLIEKKSTDVSDLHNQIIEVNNGMKDMRSRTMVLYRVVLKTHQPDTFLGM